MTVTHFAEEEAEAQRGYATSLRLLSGQGLDAGISKAGQWDIRVLASRSLGGVGGSSAQRRVLDTVHKADHANPRKSP